MDNGGIRDAWNHRCDGRGSRKTERDDRWAPGHRQVWHELLQKDR